MDREKGLEEQSLGKEECLESELVLLESKFVYRYRS
jgi:hypothetical protein